MPLGSAGNICNSPLFAEIAALTFALKECLKMKWKPMQIYTDCLNILKLISNPQGPTAWRLIDEACLLLRLLNSLQNPRIDLIDHEDNLIADHIANPAR
ncbi:uncharacterized protein LOC120255621 isoform X2 [Dioscorea cayenensis subsp. rotundata]|uniref:Uncharacterized protein LOC120255621 isoform X2 n=1 Tax=Dioscorea cayennensis subsp. rotundata TaxID=55577 RepID=A0AB40AX37_DIOCR|nr:uncharacterized protein LOC120255621 isoform X2 [Dioscorea cayenensis subsp. rotundata]